MGWQETIETDLKPLLLDSNEQGVWYRAGNRDYLAACLTDGSLTHWLARHCSELDIPTARMKQGSARGHAANSVFVVTAAMQKSQPKTYWARRD